MKPPEPLTEVEVEVETTSRWSAATSAISTTRLATSGQNGITLLPWQRGADEYVAGFSVSIDTVVWFVIIVFSLRLGRRTRRRLRTSPRLWLLAANSTAALSLLHFWDRLQNVYPWLG